MTEKKKPGPKPEVFKVPLSFKDAVKAALNTKLTPESDGLKKNGPRKEGRP